MIELHRLKGKSFYLNHRLIETIEDGVDTVLVLTNGHKYIVEESSEEIIQKIHEFEQKNNPVKVRHRDDTET